MLDSDEADDVGVFEDSDELELELEDELEELLEFEGVGKNIGRWFLTFGGLEAPFRPWFTVGIGAHNELNDDVDEVDPDEEDFG